METIWKKLSYREIIDLASNHTAYRVNLADQLGLSELYLAWTVRAPKVPSEPTFTPQNADWSPPNSIDTEEVWNFVTVREQLTPDFESMRLDDHYVRLRCHSLADIQKEWPSVALLHWIDKPYNWSST